MAVEIWEIIRQSEESNGGSTFESLNANKSQKGKPGTSFFLSQVKISDADYLVRECEFPAMQENPLHSTMFPLSDPGTWEEEIRWMSHSLRRTLATESINFRKVCTEDGTPVGFAGCSIYNSGAIRDNGGKGQEEVNSDPESLDVSAWLEVSRLLRKERERALHGRKNIWRLIVMAVNPAYQRRGVGSSLMEWVCGEADQAVRDTFVLASPAAVKLYENFGFEKVGEVKTAKGTFQSMFKKARINMVASQLI